jgi:hypothetical protein
MSRNEIHAIYHRSVITLMVRAGNWQCHGWVILHPAVRPYADVKIEALNPELILRYIGSLNAFPHA